MYIELDSTQVDDVLSQALEETLEDIKEEIWLIRSGNSPLGRFSYYEEEELKELKKLKKALEKVLSYYGIG